MRIILVFVAIAMAIATHAQTVCKIKIYYDDNGNRVQRVLECTGKPAPVADSPLVNNHTNADPTGFMAEQATGFKVYPNPSETKVNVMLDARMLSAGSSITLTDMTGRVVYRKDSIKEALSVIPLDGLTDGTYFVIVTSGSGKNTVKIVKQTGNGFQ